jgi:hypothetical protein
MIGEYLENLKKPLSQPKISMLETKNESFYVKFQVKLRKKMLSDYTAAIVCAI